MTASFRTSRHQVPVVGGLTAAEGWVDMGAVPHRQGVGRIRRTAAGMDGAPPGARHERHRHPNADEFFVVLTGAGRVYTDDGCSRQRRET